MGRTGRRRRSADPPRVRVAALVLERTPQRPGDERAAAAAADVAVELRDQLVVEAMCRRMATR
jgi:hypothetical protein